MKNQKRKSAKNSPARGLSRRLQAKVISRRSPLQKSLLKWFHAHGRDFPWREKGVSAYDLLIAEVLLKRTTAAAAQKAYRPLLHAYPDLETLSRAHKSKLETLLKGVGLQKQRAAALKKISLYLCRHEKGTVPGDLEKLLRVPHLGPYAARAVLTHAFNQPAAVVDSNVMRIYGRLYHKNQFNRNDINAYQTIADQMLPLARHREFNLALLDLGALVCRYTHPLHEECPWAPYCDYYKQTKSRAGR